MQGRRLAGALALLLVAILAMAATVRRFTSNPEPPSYVMDAPISKIDTVTLDVATLTSREWNEKYPSNGGGRWMNPKTGHYTMVDPITCAACGQLIPPPDLVNLAPEEMPSAPPDGSAEAVKRMKFAKESDPSYMRKYFDEYKCPRCGKCPFRHPDPVRWK